MFAVFSFLKKAIIPCCEKQRDFETDHEPLLVGEDSSIQDRASSKNELKSSISLPTDDRVKKHVTFTEHNKIYLIGGSREERKGFIPKRQRSNRKKQLRPAVKNYVITSLPLPFINNCACIDSDSNIDFVIDLEH